MISEGVRAMVAWVFAASCLLLPTSQESLPSSPPTDPRSAGMLGLVLDQGRWVKPEAVAAREQADSSLTSTRGEYARRRDQTPGTAEGQRALALWCDHVGLQFEALAHFHAVTRIDPEDAEAHARLGHRRYRARWLTEAEVVAETAEADAQRVADRHWDATMTAWRSALINPARKDEAARAVLKVRDPRAVPSIVRTFNDRSIWDQAWAVQILGPIESEPAAMELARLTVHGLDESVRLAALKELQSRDPRTFAPPMMSWFRVPIQYETSASRLRVEGSTAILDRTYQARPGTRGTLEISRTVTQLGSSGRPQQFRVEVRDPAGAETEAARLAVKKRQREDITAIDRSNAAIYLTNARIERTLFRTTGMDLGTDPQVWNQWWNDEQGYSYVSPPPTTKPVEIETVQVTYVSPPPVVIVTPVYGASHHSCFGAGTSVLSRSGPRPIEDLRVGDQVLTQDVGSGVVDFRPILAVFHNKPTATLRINLEGSGEEAIIATPIHRFWLVSKGWAMARDLKPGDQLRTLGGMVEVTSISRETTQPVFNLEVAGGHTFFVGTRRLLVHDNSPVAPVRRPFDASR